MPRDVYVYVISLIILTNEYYLSKIIHRFMFMEVNGLDI